MELATSSILQDLNPFLSAFLLLSLIISIVGFTPPSSIIRPAVLPLLVAFSYLGIQNLRDYMRVPFASTAGGFLAFFVFQYTQIALLGRWSFEHDGPTGNTAHSMVPANGEANGRRPIVKTHGTILERLTFGFNCLWSFREINTPYQVKNVPNFSDKDPSYVPSRSTFLTWAICKLCVSYLTMDLIGLPAPPDNAVEIFSKVSILTRLSDVSIEEVVTRIISSVAFWVMTFCFLTVINAVPSIIYVGAGLSEVKEWKPLMGNVSEAWTIRGFWGKFWHQGTRKFFAGPSEFVAHGILRLPKGSLVARYTKVFLTLFQSGIIHVVADYAGGMTLFETGSLTFFCAQALGVMLEDGVQAVYRFISGRTKDERSPLWTRVIGYIWVVVFMLFWTTPWWCYPNAIKATGALDESMIPVSVLRHFIK